MRIPSVALDSLVPDLCLSDSASVAVGGYTFVAVMKPDTDTNVFNDDWLGKLAWSDALGERPRAFDGGSMVVHYSRGKRVWWQPPADVLAEGDSAVIECLRRRITRWFDHQWSYVGIVLTISRPCKCGEAINSDSASLWGVESDVDAVHLRDILWHLAGEIALD